MFVIDFDDTLFDSQSWKKERSRLLEALGVSAELFKKTYLLARTNENGEVTYCTKRHAAILGEYGFAVEQVEKAFAQSEKILKDFLFPEAVEFLEKLRARGQPLILLSLGDAEFQYQKVKATGIEHFFDRIFMVNKTKKEILVELRTVVRDQIWFINDKISETAEAVRDMVGIKPILKVSSVFSEAEYVASGWPYFSNLREIYDHIVNHAV